MISSALARPDAGSCSVRVAEARMSGGAVTRRFQIDGIRLQLKLGRRPQGARLISRRPEQLRARHGVPLDCAAAVRHVVAGRRRGADRMKADTPIAGEGSNPRRPRPATALPVHLERGNVCRRPAPTVSAMSCRLSDVRSGASAFTLCRQYRCWSSNRRRMRSAAGSGGLF
jgi:hypothetical protein